MKERQVIGVIGAMETEVEHLRDSMDHMTVEHWLGMDFYLGMLGGVPVALVRCGIGKVNAALCAQALSTYCHVACVINTGVAGSLDARINIGDIVVSTDAVEHDFDVTPLGYAPGVISSMDTSVFVASSSMRAAAVRAIGAVAPEVAAYEGRVASGDQFVVSAQRKEFIVQTFGALCCEMEGAAIAHACHLLGIPFVIVRAISDKADGSAQMDYRTFEDEAAKRCASIVEYMVQTLG